jgi:pimeloyl-ACP methyl ester carboxylesterase
MTGLTAPVSRGVGTRVSSQPIPFYFGPRQGLFGVYHPPETTPRRNTGMVLCYPAGHECLRVHRSFRNLAASLARVGFAVLRFDYSGTGDSSGDGADATLDGWRQDLRCAMDELKHRSGVTRFGLTGQRLGAAVAWREGLDRGDVDVLMLWDPVLQGARYLADLRSLERTWLANPARSGSSRAEAAAGSLLGFTLGPAMEREILSLDLLSAPLPRTAKVLAIMASEDPDEATWCERVRAAYGPKSCGAFPTVNWNDPESIHTAVYPQSALQIITTIFDKIAV